MYPPVAEIKSMSVPVLHAGHGSFHFYAVFIMVLGK